MLPSPAPALLPITPILILKLSLVPFLIWMVTLAGRRWGPAVAGRLSALPIVAGPILLAIALEQGPLFAARAAEGTLLAVIAILLFSVVYAWAARRCGMAGSMACALLAWGLAVAVLQAIAVPLAAGFVLVWVALLLAPRLCGRLPCALAVQIMSRRFLAVPQSINRGRINRGQTKV